MSSYDSDCGMFGPDGNVYQIDYANKAIELHGLGIALNLQNTTVFSVLCKKTSPLEIPCSTRYFQLTDDVYACVVGSLPDGRAALETLSNSLNQFTTYNDISPPISFITDTLSSIFERFTHYSQARPYGCSIFVSNGVELYSVVPSGEIFANYACVAGQKWQNARVEVEKLMGEEASTVDRYGHLKRSKNEGGKLKKMTEKEGVEKAQEVIKVVIEDIDNLMYIESLVVRSGRESQKSILELETVGGSVVE
ncbi:20S proteasome alpha subunit 7 [Spironucleus salmonicida]|uniref:20S proteasome alpha subunit 7 n=1 Tax=Spironucleus salmonicida TaxID=348837 RepID=V6LVX8_9EUKA|nr:20S proteasome alpha subunit 7 [Spironucleus salmonicida]|eukprot:EST47861.1 20S proteasome alpha subunit 7 [Spironucleus salmonicida]